MTVILPFELGSYRRLGELTPLLYFNCEPVLSLDPLQGQSF